MKPEFPNKFHLASLSGPRSKDLSEREDAFQQLVGEALQCATGFRAHVATTKGRDGSIDAWVETAPDPPSPFNGLPAPIVIECKDHDDSLRDFIKNVHGGWRKVEEKLKGEAAKGWAGPFAPWKNARSYAYCVSAVLYQGAREELTRSIQAFFNDLPENQRPPLEEVRVLDWADLRPWLGSITRVSDAWLGIGSTAILSYAEYVASLRGFREYLQSSKLPFVSPGSADPSSPEALFHRLNSTPEKPGILLVGAGGVGKTRTSLEVSRLAEEAGWRSLHVLPGDEGISSDDLARAVLPGDQDTLLVFDYLDRMQQLDFGALRRSLIPQAEQRGFRVALFGNCRPGWLRQSKADRDELFGQTELRPSAQHQYDIIQTMIEKAAPRCLEHLGEEELIRICGQRPIIALLIARELERRFVGGQIGSLDIGALRTGDLVGWLRKRLAEDGMTVDIPASPLETGRPSNAMVAAAAAFVCAPNPAAALAKAGQIAVETRGGDRCDAEHVVTALKSLAWLEEDGNWLVAAHDVVADEVFDQVVRESRYVRQAELEAVLSVWSVSEAMVGRLATALRRIAGAIEDEVAIHSLEDAAAHWLEQNAASIGNYLVSGDPRFTSYALGAILDGSPWATVAIEKWSDLVSPWLGRWGTRPETRHLLYKGLRQDEVAPMLIQAALGWLEVFPKEFEASFVLAPLLGRQDLDTESAAKAIELALAWLTKFQDTIEASFVLRPLLSRQDLDTEAAAKAIEFALAWLTKFPDIIDAQFVLPPLLDRQDLDTPVAAKAIEFTLAWLMKFPDTVEAGFVLPPLLSRQYLDTEAAAKAIEWALAWLTKFPDTIEAQFVLHPLLGRQDLDTEAAAKAIEFALAWLREHQQTKDAEFVFKQLFRRPEVSPSSVLDLKRSAVERLRSRVRSTEDDEASFLLRWCLQSRVNDPVLDNDLFELALTWLEMNGQRKGADYVFNRILRRPDATPEQRIRASKVALSWLRRASARTSGLDYTINSLLRSTALRGEELEFVIQKAQLWLNDNPSHREAHRVRKSILFSEGSLPEGH